MKKLFLPAFVLACFLAMSFVQKQAPGAQVLDITDPFTNVIEITYELPSDGHVEITVSDADGNNCATVKDDARHGTHVAGMTCPPDSPDGEYRIDFAFKGQHQYFNTRRERE